MLVSDPGIFRMNADKLQKLRTEEHGFALISGSVTLPLSICVLPRWGSTFISSDLFGTSRHSVIIFDRTLASEEIFME